MDHRRVVLQLNSPCDKWNVNENKRRFVVFSLFQMLINAFYRSNQREVP